MPNPTGANAYGENSGTGQFQQSPYGAIEQLKNLTAAAPLGSPAAVNAPRRAQRAAVKGKPAAGPVPVGTPEPPISIPGASTYAQQMSQFWQGVLATPGISPLTAQFARQALGQ